MGYRHQGELQPPLLPPPPYTSNDIGFARKEYKVRDSLDDEDSYEKIEAILWAVGTNVNIWVDESVYIDWDFECDGVIDQDALGLDRVYVQAKRHKNTVSAGAIRDFTGSLEYHQANKGMFITTSTFSDSAARTAERVAKRIVLIDGQKLAALMLENSIGCLTKKSISLMRMDEDYFPN